MKNQETIKRLRVAFDADKYVCELKKRMQDVMAYSATPFNNEPPEAFKQLKYIFDHYTKEWWGDLIQDNTPRGDMAMAIGYSMITHQQQKLLSTKHASKAPKLTQINDRLSLYIEYQWYWLNNKSWSYQAKEKHDAFKMYGYLPIDYKPEPLTFPQWLYRSGYESLLSDSEFLSAVRYFDEN